MSGIKMWVAGRSYPYLRIGKRSEVARETGGFPIAPRDVLLRGVPEGVTGGVRGGVEVREGVVGGVRVRERREVGMLAEKAKGVAGVSQRPRVSKLERLSQGARGSSGPAASGFRLALGKSINMRSIESRGAERRGQGGRGGGKQHSH